MTTMADVKRRDRVNLLMRGIEKATDGTNYKDDNGELINRYTCPVCGQQVGCPNCGMVHAHGVSSDWQRAHFLSHTDEELEAVWLSVYMQQGAESNV